MTFSLLMDELARWQGEANQPRLWLRDDDAAAATEALDELLDIVTRYRTPVLLAVIPAKAQDNLAERLAGEPLVTPCQHGFCHQNHAAQGERAVELGGRALELVEGELAEGKARLKALFGDRLSSILVPPWNRLDPALPPRLPALGYSALSTFGKKRFSGVPGLGEINTHVDLVDWKGGRRGKTLDRLDGEMAEAFREARQEGGRPVGLLSHHLTHDDMAWAGLTILYENLSRAGGVAFVSADQALSSP